MLFSHDVIRPSQLDLVNTISNSLKERKNVVAHAPTGLGKTAAALCPALDIALERDLTVFFLTSRHTQHKIVLDTAKKIMDKNKIHFGVVSLIGKKHMCAQPNVENLPSGDFAEFCKSMVEGNSCEFYTNVRGKNNLPALKMLKDIKSGPPLTSEAVVSECKSCALCPYEVSLSLSEDAKVIVCDYFYIFNPHIRDALFGKLKKKLDESIIIVDEGHNLPGRVRDLLTFRLSNKHLRLAIQEAKKYNLEVIPLLVEIQEVLNRLSVNVKEDKLVKVDDFCAPLEKIKPYEELIEDLEVAAETVREEQKTSHIGHIAKFLDNWRGGADGYARIISRKDMLVTLSNRCLDPALLTKEVFDACYGSVVMSGTLSPTEMYSDVLGLKDAVCKSFKSPFPETNKLSLIIPKTTTKYSLRSERQFRDIAQVCADVANSMQRVMIFFPSYSVRDEVASFFADLYPHQMLYESPGMSKEDKQKLLDRFVAAKNAVLLGVAAGSFGEGVDLPGVLQGVVVVGLPLDRPDLETTELIAYYDKKFGKGWEYGYTLPAMTRCVQNAGRCIRTEKDRGVLVFLDERYSWPRYKMYFPPEWDLKTSFDYKGEIARFFGKLW